MNTVITTVIITFIATSALWICYYQTWGKKIDQAEEKIKEAFDKLNKR